MRRGVYNAPNTVSKIRYSPFVTQRIWTALELVWQNALRIFAVPRALFVSDVMTSTCMSRLPLLQESKQSFISLHSSRVKQQQRTFSGPGNSSSSFK